MGNVAHEPWSPTRLAHARRKAVLATLVGNFMEWFDFAVYGFVATSIGKAFFPSENETASLLASLAVFGVAFVFRPAGGALFGSIGDRFGRKTSLAAAIIVMSVATTLLAALPTYGQVGVLAPILLVLIRSVQGLSVGGEWTGASAFLVEYAPHRRRGLWASSISATAAAGVIGGSLIVFGLNTWLSTESLDAWGWRIPFLLAAPLGLVGLYLRLRLEDTPVFQDIRAARQVEKAPLRTALRQDMRLILLMFAAASATGMGFYYMATYMVNHLSQTVGLSSQDAVLLSLCSLVVYALLCPCAGMLSDRIGRRRTYILGCFGHVVLIGPVFLLIGSGSVVVAFLGLCLFTVSQSAINVMSSALVVELFPASTRMTSGAIGYNLGLGPVAGTGPLVAAALAAGTGLAVAPAFYLGAIMLVVGVVLVLFLPETFRRSLSGSAPEPLAAEAGRATGGQAR